MKENVFRGMITAAVAGAAAYFQERAISDMELSVALLSLGGGEAV